MPYLNRTAIVLVGLLIFSLHGNTEAPEFSPEFSPESRALTAERARPSLFVTAKPIEGLRSIDAVRAGISSGHAKTLWDTLRKKVDKELDQPVIAPMKLVDGEWVLGNRSYTFIAKAADRILDTALVGLILEDQRYVDATLAQIMALFDEKQWPEWSDQAHLNVGLNADLRHGQLVAPVALAYDWLYTQLTSEQRRAIIEGLDRCAITPYKKGFAANEHWMRRRSNWMTVVLGGFGIAGMALGPDHPDSTLLVENALAKMETYPDIIGPEGEFNESVQYAGSMAYVIRFFTATLYASQGKDNPFERHSFTKFYEWYMMMTFPPGRVAGFGDPGADMPPVVVPAAALAATSQDPVLQWFYTEYNDRMLESHRKRAIELLCFDDTLAPASPATRLPLGKAYHAQGHLISSRSSWDPDSTTSVVYSKAGREAYHGHPDWGQVCIDGYGERLVVDLGSTPGYPKSHTEMYYNYQQYGHNVFRFGNNETGGVSLREKGRYGKTVWSEFDPKRGGAWTLDLTEVYDEGASATRTVVHLLPRIAVVLDSARLSTPDDISMRWHLAEDVTPNADGTFLVTRPKAVLSGKTQRLDGTATLTAEKHAYVAPYDKHRLGTPLAQRNEPFLNLTMKDDHCRLLSLFAVTEPGSPAPLWTEKDNRWFIDTPEGEVVVSLTDTKLIVKQNDAVIWDIDTLDAK